MGIFNRLFGGGKGSATAPKSSSQELDLVRKLEHQDSEIRFKAAVELSRHPGEVTVTALIKALKDSDPEVRGCAAESLRLLGDPRAVEPLVDVLETDTEHNPAYSAVLALGEIGTPRAVEALISALDRRKGDLSTIASQLGKLKASGAVDALIKLLEDGTEYQRRHAVMALGKIGDRKAIEPLKRALNDADEGVRERAAEALSFFG
jgi:HEAT repeat protein